MNLRTFAFGCALLVGLAGVTDEILAQSARQDFKIKNIRRREIEAPNYSASGSGSDLGGRPSTLWRQWYKIEVQFDSEPDWADDVLLKYYVLVGKGREQRLFVGEVTHINVAKGSQHYSAMFMHPNTLRRYGGGDVQAVAVQLYYQQRLVDQDSDPSTRERWWEKFTPMTGFLLTPHETPWGPIAPERFEAVKPPRQ